LRRESDYTCMLIRMFGVFGLILASGYLVQGLGLVIHISKTLGRQDYQDLIYNFTSMSLDLVTALALVIASVGLFFAQRWAKKMWLITMSILTLLHLLLAAFYELGNGVTVFYLVWTWMVLTVTAMSWWYFSKQAPAK
jgi:hypothetical protein